MYEQQQQPFSTAHRLWPCVCVIAPSYKHSIKQPLQFFFIGNQIFFLIQKKLENCIIIIVVVELSTALSTAVLLSIVVALLTLGAYIISTDYYHFKILIIMDTMSK